MASKSHPLVQKMIDLHEKVKNLHEETYDLISGSAETLQNAVANKLELGDIADIGYFARQMELLNEESRKEVGARKELCGKLLSVAMVQIHLRDPDKAVTTIKGNFSSATTDVSQQPKVPKKGTPEFTSLMVDHFGIPLESIDSNCISLSWTGMKHRISDLMEAGKPLPPEIKKTYPVYRATFRRLKKRKQ